MIKNKGFVLQCGYLLLILQMDSTTSLINRRKRYNE